MKYVNYAKVLLLTVLVVVGIGVTHRALAQGGPGDPRVPSWMAPVWRQSLHAPMFNGVFREKLPPAVIPQTLSTPDPTGIVTTYQPAGATITSQNAFFQSLGTNKRTCFTCHQPRSGWSITPRAATSQFLATNGMDPLFSPVDGANCPDLGASARTLGEKALASSQLLTKGDIRVFLPVPANAQYQVRVLRDPYGCEKSSIYGLPTGVISIYRRVLNSTNLAMNGQFGATHSVIVPEGTIMWDGREPTLEQQFLDATLGHAQAAVAPTDEQIAQGVAFETGIFTAQSFDRSAQSLTASGATGGPVALSKDVPIVSSAGLEGMTLYDSWATVTSAAQASIKRGQDIYNNRQFVVSGIAGLNDTRGNPTTGTCAGCHSNQNVGNAVNAGGKHLGIGDNSSADQSGNQTSATVLPPAPDQPLFSFLCPRDANGNSIIPFFSNPVKIGGITYDDFQTSDPGMGLITGNCADLGKFKVPRLRGLAARAPYFHGGNAASLTDVVEFYNKRLNLGLTQQEKQDLINFLNTL